MDISQFVQLGGTVGALMFFLIALLKGWVVTAAALRAADERTARAEKERDAWKEMALTATRAGERGIAVAEQGMQVLTVADQPRRLATDP